MYLLRQCTYLFKDGLLKHELRGVDYQKHLQLYVCMRSKFINIGNILDVNSQPDQAYIMTKFCI